MNTHGKCVDLKSEELCSNSWCLYEDTLYKFEDVVDWLRKGKTVKRKAWAEDQEDLHIDKGGQSPSMWDYMDSDGCVVELTPEDILAEDWIKVEDDSDSQEE